MWGSAPGRGHPVLTTPNRTWFLDAGHLLPPVLQILPPVLALGRHSTEVDATFRNERRTRVLAQAKGQPKASHPLTMHALPSRSLLEEERH
jgi:hypothetical protein